MKDKDKDKKPETAPETKATAPEQAKPVIEETVDDRLETIMAELAEIKDKYLRMLAETDNFKKRNAEELKREKAYASMPVCDKMIDAIETVEQALGMPTEDPQFKNFLYGFRMIKDMILNVLVDEGVKLIPMKVGDPFDPNIAHAIDTSHDPELPENTILKIIKNGYRYKDRLLRPAMVLINIKPLPQETEPEEPSENEKLADNVA